MAKLQAVPMLKVEPRRGATLVVRVRAAFANLGRFSNGVDVWVLGHFFGSRVAGVG